MQVELPMDRARLEECRHICGWSVGEFRRRMVCAGINDRRVRRWLAGQDTIPQPIATWLWGYAAYAAAHPVPDVSKIIDEEIGR